MRAVDLFAGPGGWDWGAQELGVDPLGIELDEAACATREAVGLKTLPGDVADLDPAMRGPVDLLIASPPCQAFSTAGKGEGKLDLPMIWEATTRLAAGDPHGVLESELADPRSLLVVEPLRWALALRPRLIACEQVPAILPYWRQVAEILRAHGYAGTWAGTLHSERYGVPQTRERAILLARLDGPVGPPPPTHQKWVKGQPACEEHSLEGSVLPWVSMAEALGLGMTERPYPTIASGRTTGGPDREKVGGSAARAAIYAELDRGAWKIRDTGNTRGGSRPYGRERDIDQPAPVVTSRADQLAWVTHLNPRQAPARSRSIKEPAPTMLAEGLAHGVPVWDRGEKDLRDTTAQDERAVRISLDEAAVLQGFPPDYPWQGNSSQRFSQVGNAVPPPMALAILRGLLGDAVELREAA